MVSHGSAEKIAGVVCAPPAVGTSRLSCGLIERTVNPNNRRRNIVSITPAGSAQLRSLDRVIDEIQERVLAPLSQTSALN
jgi:hypothetical protein